MASARDKSSFAIFANCKIDKISLTANSSPTLSLSAPATGRFLDFNSFKISLNNEDEL